MNSEISTMHIGIVSFGKISEFIGNQKVEIPGLSNSDELKVYLEETYPKLKNLKYRLALNNKLVHKNLPVADNDTVAIMPPFSGG
jgi:molybdopterin synthase sulfur carrier subunit